MFMPVNQKYRRAALIALVSLQLPGCAAVRRVDLNVPALNTGQNQKVSFVSGGGGNRSPMRFHH
jgi:hypothetical protein